MLAFNSSTADDWNYS